MSKTAVRLKVKTYPYTVRQWNIPGCQWRIRLIQQKNKKYVVRMQPFHDQGDLSSRRWYAFTYPKEFDTECGAVRAVLDRLDGGDL